MSLANGMTSEDVFFESLNESYENTFAWSKDPTLEPLPTVYRPPKCPMMDTELVRIMEMVQHVPMWCKPMPIVRRVRDQTALSKSISYIEKQKIIALNIFSKKMDRSTAPSFITIACSNGGSKSVGVVFVYKYCKPTALALKGIIMSEKSTKLVSGVERLSDILSHQVYPGEKWDAEKHNVVDVCILQLDTKMMSCLLDSTDIKKAEKVQPPTLQALEQILPEEYPSLDHVHFPVYFSDLKDNEYRLLEIEEYSYATYNFVARTSMSLFCLYENISHSRWSLRASRVHREMVRTSNAPDEVWKKWLIQRRVDIPVYDPRSILSDKKLIKQVPDWPAPLFDVVWIDSGNMSTSLSSLNSLPPGSYVAINIYGQFVDRFTDPKYLAIGTLNDRTSQLTVFMIKFTDAFVVEAVYPFLMREDTYKILPVVNYIYDALFKRIYKHKKDSWSVHRHNLIDLRRFDNLVSVLEQTKSFSDVRRGGRNLSLLIVHYGLGPLNTKYFPLMGNQELLEAYLLHIKPKTYPVIRNFIAREIISMFFLQAKILRDFNRGFIEKMNYGINLVASEEDSEKAANKLLKLQSSLPFLIQNFSNHLQSEQTISLINKRMGSLEI